ncbi:MAG: LysM peptidoglycan-binding domain-containing protein [Anaerolineales bacterium]
MSITHEEAHRLIQFDTDNSLNAAQKITLSAHLDDCLVCRSYSEDIRELESILLPAMRKHWNLQPLPFSTAVLGTKKVPKVQANLLLATRRVAVVAVLMAFVFAAWQFTLANIQTASHLPLAVPPVPTPSTESTHTKIVNCTEIFYKVQEGDTLESIASQFSASKTEIMSRNQMQTETIHPGMELTVPLCKLTPTGTLSPTLLTNTHTPVINPITSAPGG